MFRLRVFYRKEGMGVLISEKNLQRCIERTLRRMELPLKFTEGFSPHPRISFGHPLPVGIEGINETFDVFLLKKIDIISFLEKSRKLLPEGIVFTSGRWIDPKSPFLSSIETFARYIIELGEDIDITHFEKMGKVVKFTEGEVIMETKINNFSHRELVKLLIEGKIKSIKREILIF